MSVVRSLKRFRDWSVEVYPPRTLAIVALVTAIAGFAGPVGTFHGMPPGSRMIYWGGLIFGAVPFARAFRLAVDRRFPRLSTWQCALLVATAFSFAYTPVVYLATLAATQFGLTLMVPLWVMWQGTFLASAAAYGVRATVMEFGAVQAPAGLPDAPRGSGVRLLQRLDSTLRGKLVSLSVRDHYVDVRTDAGQASLLMRLSDAIAETEGVDGAQVHRSHWVAWDAVIAVEQQSGKLVLRTSQNTLIPVSRNHRDKVQDRGLI